MREYMRLMEGTNRNVLAESSIGRILTHIRDGQPFIQLTASRRGLPRQEVRRRNNEIVRDLRKHGLASIRTMGGWDEEDAKTKERTTVVEDSLFIPLNDHTTLTGDDLMRIGQNVGQKYEQDAIVYGDGQDIFLLDFRASDGQGDLYQIGTYDALDMNKMPYGWSAPRSQPGKKFAWTFPKDADGEKPKKTYDPRDPERLPR